MSGPRVLMLVSAFAGEGLRREVSAGYRPCPEYLRLEASYGVNLLDWSRLGRRDGGRSLRRSIQHVAAALRRLDGIDVIFSDGEHLGIPLALALRGLGRSLPHLMLGHHLTTAAKRRLFRWADPQSGITRILVHSRRQQQLAELMLRVPRDKLAFLPYYADPGFWGPAAAADEPIILAVGQEHRDYVTLARACAGLSERVFIARGSAFSPRAHASEPERLPAQFSSSYVDHRSLREWYARASVVAVPLLPNDFQAGVTTILEAMAMGKATVVSATAGQRDIIDDGQTGILVQPGDAGELRRALRFLIAHPEERARLGTNARRAVEERFGLHAYARTLWQHCNAIAANSLSLVAGRT